MKHILTCASCKGYTMKAGCACGEVTIPARPPKYSPDDKYSGYRREAKRKDLEEKGLI